MPKVRTTVENVSTVLKALVKRDLAAAAGTNGVLSRAEQAKAPKYLSDAANVLRAQKPNARITVDAMEAFVATRANQLIGEVNQPRGSGAATLSKTEAAAALAREPSLGFAVMEAYQIASGSGVSVDTIAQSRASQVDDDTTFKKFATEAEAVNYRDPDGKQVSWLVRTGDSLLSSSYVSGRNDLWAQRFDVDKRTGAVTVTHEH